MKIKIANYTNIIDNAQHLHRSADFISGIKLKIDNKDEVTE